MMKKIIALMLIFVLSISMVACNKNKEETNGENRVKVLNLHGESFLILNDNRNTVNLSGLIIIHVPENQMIEAGKVYTAIIEDEIAESFPPQARAKSIELENDEKPEAISFEIADSIQQHLPENSYLIDVRTEEEFDEGHIPGALLMPLDNIENEIENSDISNDDVIIVYCRSGSRSNSAASIIREIGYSVVLDAGGIMYYDGELEY
ncbi:MAG: rhodanese-like domain-containing protein [Clostridiaceae bacterium]|nr:rhodanese-like domain-containing protein [Clostridiaceae bacterium]